jgi:N utilization substance protein A
MNNELLTVFEYLEQERGVTRDMLIEAVEVALLSAARKSIHPAKELEVKIDRVSGEIRAWATLKVVETPWPGDDEISLEEVQKKVKDAKVGDILKWEVTPKNFGRIAAQTARQTLMQQLRKAEKAIVKEEFQESTGQILNGVVRRIESGNVIVDLQKAEGIIQTRDKIPGEQFMQGDRVNALLVRVETTGSGPSLILSRTNPDFVKKLFEREVSEIHDGVVQIMGLARDPGSRTKIAVKSNDQRVDPIGACVGMRGMRVRNIISELGGERVDIVRYDENIKVYATNALLPAKPSSIEIADEAQKTLRVYVDKEQLPLAFGKRSINVTLASRLLGWGIGIIEHQAPPTEEESFEEKKEKAIQGLSEEFGIDAAAAERLVNNGLISVEALKSVGEAEIQAVEGLSPEDAGKIIEKLKSM